MYIEQSGTGKKKKKPGEREATWRKGSHVAGNTKIYIKWNKGCEVGSEDAILSGTGDDLVGEGRRKMFLCLE